MLYSNFKAHRSGDGRAGEGKLMFSLLVMTVWRLVVIVSGGAGRPGGCWCAGCGSSLARRTGLSLPWFAVKLITFLS